MFVAIGPGHSAVTPTFVPSSSCSSASDSDSTAYLLIEYGPWLVPRRFCVAATEAVLTTCPPSPCFRIAGTKWRRPGVTPPTSTPIHQPGARHRHAGIVAGDVELAEATRRLRQRVDHRLLLGDVDPDRQHLLVGAGQLVRGLLHRLLLDVGHHDVGARFGKRRGDAEADAR